MPNVRIIALSLIVSLASIPLLAQSGSDEDLLARIRKEEANNSQLMKTEHVLTDIYGPRLTGSPNYKRAADWAVKQMTEWGLQSAHLESWNFGHPGWLNERLTAHIVSPVKEVLTCKVVAWTPGTKGVVRARVYQLILPEQATQEQLTSFFEKLRSIAPKLDGNFELALVLAH